jgi:hypothetical protein
VGWSHYEKAIQARDYLQKQGEKYAVGFRKSSSDIRRLPTYGGGFLCRDSVFHEVQYQ